VDKIVGVGFFFLGCVFVWLYRRERRLEAGDRERAGEEERRYAGKRGEFIRLIVGVRSREPLLDPTHFRIYAHEHYEEIMAARGARRAQIAESVARWEGDPDWKRLRRENPEAELALQTLQRELELYSFVEGLTEAQRESWKTKQMRRYQEAKQAGLTVEELENRERTGERDGWLEACRRSARAWLVGAAQDLEDWPQNFHARRRALEDQAERLARNGSPFGSDLLSAYRKLGEELEGRIGDGRTPEEFLRA